MLPDLSGWDMSGPAEMASTDELVNRIVALSGERSRVVVAVAGPPGSGKSTTAEGMVKKLNARAADSAAVFPMDGYHYDDLVLNERGWRQRKGAPHTFDVAGFAHMLARLRRNNEAEVAVPIFDRSIEIARAGARIIPQSITYLVVEGNYLLLDDVPWDSLAQHFDVSVFIDVPEAELRRRLEHRWRDLPVDARNSQVEDNDLPNARFVQYQSRPADIILRPQV